MVVVNRGNGVVVVEFSLPGDRERWLCLRNWDQWAGMEVVYTRMGPIGSWLPQAVRMLALESAYSDILRLLEIMTSDRVAPAVPGQDTDEPLETTGVDDDDGL